MTQRIEVETIEPSYGTFTNTRTHIRSMEQHYRPYRLLDTWKSFKQNMAHLQGSCARVLEKMASPQHAAASDDDEHMSRLV